MTTNRHLGRIWHMCAAVILEDQQGSKDIAFNDLLKQVSRQLDATREASVVLPERGG